MRLRRLQRPLLGGLLPRRFAAVFLAAVSGILWLVGPDPAAGQVSRQESRRVRDLTQATIEELMNLEVSSASRKDQKLSKTAAAAYVVSADDIRRSGAMSIPEILRMVPGLQVARIDSNKWAVSARGFNGRFANKLLVLVDGRSLYNNLYAGVYWEQLDLVIADIERIEVIRGPGATMWGANAVNGVINILTKSARQTEGVLIATGAGSEDHAVAGIRAGVKANEALSYRVFAKYVSRDGLRTATGAPADDRWTTTRGGGRLDWQLNQRDSLSVQGDLYEGDTHERVFPNFPYLGLTPPLAAKVDFHGGYLQAHWERALSDESSLGLRMSCAETRRRETFGTGRFTDADFDFQHRFAVAHRHDVVWGLGYRRLADRIDPGQRTSFVPPERSDDLFSGFLQDDISLAADRLVLSAGSKFQHNSYSGFEVQPGIRLLWNPSQNHGAWAAVSRAVRTPARRDHDLRLEFDLPPGSPPGAVGRIIGDESYRSETILAREAGYRRQFSPRLSVDLALFYNTYGRLQTPEHGLPFVEPNAVPRLVVPVYYGNNAAGTTYGTETAANWNPRKGWTLTASHSWLVMKLRRQASFPAAFDRQDEGRSPRHQVQLRSLADLTSRLSLDLSAFYVAALPATRVPSYWRLDAHVGLRLTQFLEASAGGMNLLDSHHLEYVPEDYVMGSEARRSAYLKLTWRF